ncbi:sodium-coupled monocarboxylate transporter 1-like protein, partial [Leptotrombidium deliense]
MALFGVVDYIIFIGLIFVSLLIGIYFAIKDRAKNSNDYLTGGKQMKTLPVVFSLMAS